MKRPKRKAIPKWVKDAVLKRQGMACAECGNPLMDGVRDPNRTEYDHRPSILMRMVNVDGTDYHPPQNDPDHIEALHKACHLRRTVGRIPGAEKTVTTKDSDAHLRKKFNLLEGRTTKRKYKWPSKSFPKKQKGFRT